MAVPKSAVSLRNLPIGLFGAVMGLAGLGLTARATATVIPGFIRAPAYFTELWVALGVLFFVPLIVLYLAKLVRYPAAVKSEFLSPMQLGFCGTLPVGMSLVAGGIAPYLPGLGSVVWWVSFVMLLAFQLWALYRWLSGGIELAQVNAGWLVVMVGGILVVAVAAAIFFHTFGTSFMIAANGGGTTPIAAQYYSLIAASTKTEGTNETGFIPTSDLPVNTTLYWRATAMDSSNGSSSPPRERGRNSAHSPVAFACARTERNAGSSALHFSPSRGSSGITEALTNSRKRPCSSRTGSGMEKSISAP